MKAINTPQKIGLLVCPAILATSVCLADYVSTVTALNPVGYYRLNDTKPVPSNLASNSGTAGALGNGFYIADDPSAPMHGTNTPGALVGSTNTAATFNPGYMQVPFDPSINPQGAFTAEAWVQPGVTPTPLTCVMSYGHLQNQSWAPNRSGWLLYQDDGSSSGGSGWNFRMYNHNGINRSLTLTGGAVPSVSTWTHVAVAYDGTNGFLYVNGVQVASGLAPGYAANVDGNFSVGTRNDLAFPYAGGAIDEVAVYTNALSPADILAHYQNGINPTPTTPYDALVKASFPLLYYRFDEPAFTPSTNFPTTANLGSWGMAQAGNLEDNLVMGQPGVPYPGFAAGNLAPHFNGLAGSVFITNPPLNTASVTFTAWVKREGPTDGDSQGAFGLGISKGDQGWAGLIFQRGLAPSTTAATGLNFGEANDLRYTWENGDYTWVPSPRMVVPDRVWSFVAGIFTPTQTILCLNGVFATNVVNHTAHDFSADPLYIGQDPIAYPGYRFVQGYIDEVAIFDKALTPADLQQLYSAGNPPPVITTQPQGLGGTLYEGSSVSFSVAAVGGEPLNYQWTKNGNPVNGATGTVLSMNDLHAGDSGNYAAVVTNAFGSVTSSVVTLTVLAGPPILTTVPVSVSLFPGGTANFGASALGSTPITYQWLKDSTPIPGATGQTLTISLVQPSDIANYSVTATNPYGQTNSPAATITLLPVSPNAVSAILALGPVAYWRLNETNGTTAFDSVGGFNGTFNPVTTHNGVPGLQPPAFAGFEANNTAFSFDGSTSDISTTTPNFTTATATILGFIQPQGTINPTDPPGIIVSRGSASAVVGILLRNASGNLMYDWNDNPSDYNWDSGLLPVTAQWNFVALVVETNQAIMYLDSGTGLTSATNVVDHAPERWIAPVHLGTDPTGNRVFHGLLDEMAIYPYALSPAQIQAVRDGAFKNLNNPVPPSVIVQPESQTFLAGDSDTLTASAAGSPPLTFQWTKNGVSIPGAIRGTLSLPSLSSADSGTYQWVVTQGSTSVTSAPALVTVLPLPQYAYLTNNLVLHLKFDGDYTDASGRHNDGIASGSPTFVPGKLGQAVVLQTTSVATNYVTLGTAPDFSFTINDSFSVSYWMKYTNWHNDLPMIGNSVSSTYQLGWVFADEGGKIELSLCSTANSGTYVADPVPGSPIINDNAWHNIVGVVDRVAQIASVYVDGYLAGSFSIVGLDTLDYSTALVIGQNPNGDYSVSGGGLGSFDDVGIWRTALSPIDARSIYFSGQNGHSFDVPPAPIVTVTLSISIVGGNLQIQWPSGTLESSTQVNTGYTAVNGAAPPTYTIPLPATGSAFYRVRVQ